MLAITFSTAKLKPRETGLVPGTSYSDSDVLQVVSAKKLPVEVQHDTGSLILFTNNQLSKLSCHNAGRQRQRLMHMPQCKRCQTVDLLLCHSVIPTEAYTVALSANNSIFASHYFHVKAKYDN